MKTKNEEKTKMSSGCGEPGCGPHKERQKKEAVMNKKWIWFGMGSGFLVALLILGFFAFLNSEAAAAVAIKAYVETFHGLNHDMRETLHKIREGHNVNANIEILHDQIHLTKDTLHLVKKGNEQDPHFKKLHDLHHDMREAWHNVKKDRNREQNLQALHDHLHEMRETLHAIKGAPGPHEGQ